MTTIDSTTFKCELCGEPVDPTSNMTYQLTMGWVKKRTGGGANDIRLKKTAQRFAHDTCVGKASRGINPGQGGLLG